MSKKNIGICLICGKEFVEKNKGQKYCSSKCFGISRIGIPHYNRGEDKKCIVCGRMFYSSPSSAGKYCSKKCADIGKRQNLLGKRFGMLVVTSFVGGKGTKWKCRCDCGNEVIRSAGELTRYPDANCSCGCQRLHHGMSREHFYKKWNSILCRCTNTHCASYDKYGGRGIICEWENFNEFKNDMYESYLEHCKIYGKK